MFCCDVVTLDGWSAWNTHVSGRLTDKKLCVRYVPINRWIFCRVEDVDGHALLEIYPLIILPGLARKHLIEGQVNRDIYLIGKSKEF